MWLVSADVSTSLVAVWVTNIETKVPLKQVWRHMEKNGLVHSFKIFLMHVNFKAVGADWVLIEST